MEGWIKLHRKSLNHWLYKENRAHTRREAWEDLLLYCNHSDEKVLIGNELIECKRGQSIKSLQTWSKIFNWNISKVRRFLILLENDSMIQTENVRKTTRVTVCNYEDYQGERNNNETQVKRKRNASETQVTTNNNDKNVKNDKNIIYNEFYDSEIENSNNNENYIQFVKILFGENNSGLILSGVLKLKNQLTWRQFQLIYSEKKKNGISLTTVLENLENRPDHLKKYSVLQRVLLNWMKKNKK